MPILTPCLPDSSSSHIPAIKKAAETVENTLKNSIPFDPYVNAEYPFKAPEVKFITPCYHPNVDQFGNICLDILKEKWSAAYSVRTLLLSIQSLLGKQGSLLCQIQIRQAIKILLQLTCTVVKPVCGVCSLTDNRLIALCILLPCCRSPILLR